MKAIETEFMGVRFRSRLEAKWALFFESLGYPWEYEPEGFEMSTGERYLPDFRVQYPGRGADEIHFNWFEVKPDIGSIKPAEWLKMARWCIESDEDLVLLDGPPEFRMYWRISDFTITEKPYLPDGFVAGNEFWERHQEECDEYASLDGEEIRHVEYAGKSYEREVVRKIHLPTAKRLEEASSKRRYGWALWSGKGRLWVDPHDYFEGQGYIDGDDPYTHAISAVRRHRFFDRRAG